VQYLVRDLDYPVELIVLVTPCRRFVFLVGFIASFVVIEMRRTQIRVEDVC
jgi:hypothetical protein